MSNTIPNGWSVQSLADIAKFVMGQAPAGKDCNKDGIGTPFVKAGEFSARYPIIREWTTRPLKLAKTGDVLICVVGATAGKLNLGLDCAIGRSVAAIQPNKVPTLYLYNFMQQQVDRLRSGSSGSAQGVITIEHLSNIIAPFPPLPEQQKIATILSSVDDVIEKTRAQIDKLKDLKTGMMQELLTKGIGHTEFKDSPIGRIPTGWKVVKLGGSLGCIDSGWSPSCIEIPPAPSKWGVLKVSSVTRGEFLESESKTLPEELLPRINAQVHAGDVLLTRANGVAELVGKCVIVRKEPQAKLMMSDKILRLKPSPTLHNEFLLHIFNSQIVRKQIELSWGGSSGQKNIGQSDIKSYLIPLPSVEEQRLIARCITQVEQVVFDKNKKLVALMGTKKALMQDLLTGKVRVNLTDKESAVV